MTTLEALETAFEDQSNYQIEIVAGSTGKLYAQIVHGAPYDLFLAADQARPTRLVEAQATVPEGHFTYAQGRLALWSAEKRLIEAVTLLTPPPTRIALANPDLAPYGLAATQLIDALDVTEALEERLVLGENVGQAFAFVRTGNAPLGLVSYAQILALPEAERGSYWLPSPELYDPIKQDAVLLLRGADNPAALAFWDYLQSKEAQDIIAARGYEPF